MFISEMFGDSNFGMALFTTPVYSEDILVLGLAILQILTERGQIGLRLSYYDTCTCLPSWRRPCRRRSSDPRHVSSPPPTRSWSGSGSGARVCQHRRSERKNLPRSPTFYLNLWNRDRSYGTLQRQTKYGQTQPYEKCCSFCLDGFKKFHTSNGG